MIETMNEKTVLYVHNGAPISRLLEFIKERINGVAIDSFIVASNKGGTALKVKESFIDLNVISVTEFTYSEDIKKKMKKLKITSIENAYLPIQDRKGMKEALLFFGAGMKAALEVTAVAAERDLVNGASVSIAGGHGGFDTAIIVKPSSPEYFDSPDPQKRMRVLEILVLPSRQH